MITFCDTFTLPFDGLALFTTQCHGETLYGPLVAGAAVIEFDNDADWRILDIRIQCENYKCGQLNVSNDVYIDDHGPLYHLIRDALIANYSERIEEMVREQLAEAA